MSLPLSILLEQLAAFDPSAQNVDPDLRLATVQDFPGWDRPLRDDILYLTPEVSRLPATVKTVIPPAKPLCFAIPAELAGDLPLDRADCRLLLLPETASYADACVQLRSLFARQDAWEQILPETDVLIISLPGTKESFHMVGERQLSLLPDGAVIINVGRGSVIDQETLIRELEKGRLHAGLDVFEQEPPAPDDPVWELPNLLITPHTAGNMTLAHTVNRIVEMFLEDLDAYCAGQTPKRLIDRTRGY